LIDPAAGEWRWRVSRSGESAGLPLVGRWKCPYHNGRMCIEASSRLRRLIADGRFGDVLLPP
jgi:mannobiose 2-epimerase